MVTLQYTEIAWALLFEQGLTDAPRAAATKYVGVVLIIGGAVLHEMGGDKLLLDACSGRAAAEGYCDPRNTNAGCDPEGGSEAETGLSDEEPAEASPPRQSIATYFCLGTIALLLFAAAGYQEQL